MRQLIASTKGGTWQTAFEQMLEGMDYSTYHRQYVLSERRAGWWPLLALRPDSRVLDWGCGWGPISWALSKRSGVVVACDACLERLQFIKIRAFQEGNDKIQFAWAGDAPRFPFSDAQFDVVVLNGVLEWVAMNRTEDPGEIQKQFLREVARVLKPTGQLMLAIENRYSLHYFLGQPEDHAKLRFISLLPRQVASFYSRIRKGDMYRNWTYSFWDYERLLRTTGFLRNEILVPMGDYRHFHAIVDPRRRTTTARYFFERRPGSIGRITAALAASTARLLAPSFCIIGDRVEKQHSFLQDLGHEISRGLGLDAPAAEINWSQYRVTRGDGILFQLQLSKTPKPLMVRIPLTQVAAERCRRGFDSPRILREKLTPDLKDLIPAPLLSGTFRNTLYFVEEVKHGISAACYATSRKNGQKWKLPAAEFLAQVHMQTAAWEKLDDEAWGSWVAPRILQGLLIIQEQIQIEPKRITDFLQRHLLGSRWPFAFNHGDYWAGNLLFANELNRLVAVIDWDRAEPDHGLPMFDIMHAAICSKSEAQQLAVGALIGTLLNQGLSHSWDATMFKRYLHDVGIDLTDEQFKSFAVLYWLHLVTVLRTQAKNEHLGYGHWSAQFIRPANEWLPILLQA